MRRAWVGLLLLAGCGYHFEGDPSSESLTTISVPYIKGDSEGVLNGEIAKALTTSGVFDYAHSAGAWVLEAAIISDGDDRIGFRYDRNPTTGTLRDNIVGTENRRTLGIEFKLIDPHSEEIVFGPEVITVTADYDYVDGNSIRDLVFIEEGKPRTVLDFSVGQLDNVVGAHDDVNYPIYQMAAQKITQRLLLHRLKTQN